MRLPTRLALPLTTLLALAGAVVVVPSKPAAGAGPKAGTTTQPPLRKLPPGPLFTDETASSGLDFVHFSGMSGEYYLPENTGGGAALFDCDNDGDLDAYLVQGHMLGPGKTPADATFPPEEPLPLSDRLYRNDLEVRPDGTRTVHFTDITDASGLAKIATGYGMGVSTGDFDNDGDVDVYLTNYGSNQLLRNDGDCKFTDVTATAGADDPRWSVGASWVDYDRDGWLDLFVINYADFDFKRNRACSTPSGRPDYCSPLVLGAVPDALFHNLGRGADGAVHFEDVSKRVGISETAGTALGTIAADFDGDGWPDIYVANDQMPNFLWMNQQGKTFREDALLAGAAVNREGLPEASMGVDAADIDRDGDEDLFMAHLSGETNTLFVNDGTGLFLDETPASGMGPESMPYTTFGASFLDFDNDGWLDLLLVSGTVNAVDELVNRRDPYPYHQKNQLLRNVGGNRFVDVTREAGDAFTVSEVSRGAAFGDVDNDGDFDVLITNNSGPARLLINRVGQEAQWLGLRLVGGDPPRDMLGARAALLTASAPPLWRRSHTDGSYASSRDPRVVFGLGDGMKIQGVRVVWPDGTEERWGADAVGVGRYTTLHEGSGAPVAKAPR